MYILGYCSEFLLDSVCCPKDLLGAAMFPVTEYH